VRLRLCILQCAGRLLEHVRRLLLICKNMQITDVLECVGKSSHIRPHISLDYRRVTEYENFMNMPGYTRR
jgi:hypothetical protein